MEKVLTMTPKEAAQAFVDALQRQIARKSLFADGINNRQNPLVLVASIAEELGEVATDYARQREYGAVAECIDVAHSAMLLAITLDPNGEILEKLGWPQP